MEQKRSLSLTISPLFWVTAAIIGYLYTGSAIGAIMGIIVIFVSVLVHELGHALTAIIFGQTPQIALVALGGATSYDGKNLKFWQQFLIVLNGPLFGIALCGITFFLFRLALFQNIYVMATLKLFYQINLIWTIANLLPILPLDGGQLLRITLEGFFGIKGFKISLFIGMIFAFALSLTFFVLQYFLAGALFFLFAFEGFNSWRKAKIITKSDRNEEFEKDMQKAEMCLKQGNIDGATDAFKKIREETHDGGMLYVSATHYLALLELEKGKKQEAYKMLLSIIDNLNEETKCVLHQLAFDEKNYEIVAKFATTCYQIAPSEEVALRNAKAYAALNKPKLSGGWLSTAIQDKIESLEGVLSENIFDRVRESEEFKKFFN
jgi:stage IV sporulation protein FB